MQAAGKHDRGASLYRSAGFVVLACTIAASCGSPVASTGPEGGDGGAGGSEAGANADDGGTKVDARAGGDGGPTGDGTAPDGTTADGAAPDTGLPPYCPVGASPGVTVVAGPGNGSAAHTIALDGAGTGRRFDGLGAISGGGGNSRLLFDYPEPERSEILDYLFKPGYGAALHILKVEIGGDTQSTDGAEPSHMHTASDLSCNRGYEWWLMQQAKARNPSIKLYGLAWGAPGWIGGGQFWSPDMVNYLLKWLGCATSAGLTIDYLGGWNERGHDKGWYESLHAALASNGYATQVVCDDSDWAAGADMASDPAFKAACDLVGVHYPCGGDGASATSCPANATSEGLGVPLWASENGSQDYNDGAQAMARAINRGYIDARMTSFINWPLIAAIGPNLAWETMGLAVSNQPWSGWYDIGKQLWVTAHTTQFAQPGWTYIDKSSGYIGDDSSSGSYVTLTTAGGAYSVVLETADATVPQTIAFTTSGGLSTGDVHIWATDLGSSGAHDYLVHGTDVTGAGGSYWATLEPNYVYTITTTTGQCKSAATSPPPQPSQALPYAEDFEGYQPGMLARLLSAQEGAFEVVACGGGRAGQCYRQTAPIMPIGWSVPGTPFALVGTNWTDYTVTADALLESPGSVELMGRFSGLDYGSDAHVDAYYLSVSDAGAWSIYANNSKDGAHRTLASGNVSPLGTSSWHTISFGLHGSTLTATVDGTVLGTAQDGTFGAGPAGLSVGSGSSSWLNAQFDNLRVTVP